jgi:hypothetical protein
MRADLPAVHNTAHRSHQDARGLPNPPSCGLEGTLVIFRARVSGSGFRECLGWAIKAIYPQTGDGVMAGSVDCIQSE